MVLMGQANACCHLSVICRLLWKHLAVCLMAFVGEADFQDVPPSFQLGTYENLCEKSFCLKWNKKEYNCSEL